MTIPANVLARADRVASASFFLLELAPNTSRAHLLALVLWQPQGTVLRQAGAPRSFGGVENQPLGKLDFASSQRLRNRIQTTITPPAYGHCVTQHSSAERNYRRMSVGSSGVLGVNCSIEWRLSHAAVGCAPTLD